MCSSSTWEIWNYIFLADMIENVVRCDLVVINQVEFTLFPANVVCHDFMFLGNYSAEERINQQFEVLMLMLDNSLCRCLYYCIQGKVAGVLFLHFTWIAATHMSLLLFFDEATKTFKVLFGLLRPT